MKIQKIKPSFDGFNLEEIAFSDLLSMQGKIFIVVYQELDSDKFSFRLCHFIISTDQIKDSMKDALSCNKASEWSFDIYRLFRFVDISTYRYDVHITDIRKICEVDIDIWVQ